MNAYAQPGTLQRATLGGASRDVLESVQDADWMPDGSSLAVTHYVDNKFKLEGAPVALTPEGVTGLLVTPDGTRLVVRDRGLRRLYPIDGKGEPEVMKFLDVNDQVLRFTTDGRALLIRRPLAPGGPVEVVRVDLATGARTTVRTIPPVPEALGTGVGLLLITSDGAAYVQGYGVTQSDLFLVNGLR